MRLCFPGRPVAASLALALTLAACGGDSSGPTPPRYLVSGAVSGLAPGKSLVIRNNGADQQSISANGGFGFATKLKDGTAYAVTVATQPAGMFCPVTNGSGTIAAADVTDVAIDCAAVTTTPDPAFGGGAGFVTLDSGDNGDDSGNELVLDGSGRLVIPGHSFDAATGSLDMAVWRLNADGTPDGSFGSAGLVRHPGEVVTGTNAPQVVGSSARVDGSGRIVIAGYDIDSAGIWGVAVWRFTSGGAPDATFGTNGLVRLTSPQAGGVGLALDASGRPVVSGFAWNGTDWDAAVWRFTTAGIPDSTFGGTGLVTQNSSAGSGQAMGEDIGVGVAVDGSGRIVMAGYSSNAAGNQDMTVWRYNADGTPDAGFGSNGVFRHDNAAGGGGNDVGRTLAVDGSGRIVVVGWSPGATTGDDFALWRLTPGGALDGSFNGQGFVTQAGAAGGNGTDTGRDVAIDGQGRIVATGESANPAGDLDMVVWRFTAAGIPDSSFNGQGVLVHAGAAGGTAANDAGRGVAIDGQGRIVVAGRSTTAGGTLDLGVWRIVP